jgi:hypothetical protein
MRVVAEFRPTSEELLEGRAVVVGRGTEVIYKRQTYVVEANGSSGVPQSRPAFHTASENATLIRIRCMRRGLRDQHRDRGGRQLRFRR